MLRHVRVYTPTHLNRLRTIHHYFSSCHARPILAPHRHRSQPAPGRRLDLSSGRMIHRPQTWKCFDVSFIKVQRRVRRYEADCGALLRRFWIVRGRRSRIVIVALVYRMFAITTSGRFLTNARASSRSAQATRRTALLAAPHALEWPQMSVCPAPQIFPLIFSSHPHSAGPHGSFAAPAST